MKWFDLFRDEKLQELIRIALKENYDVRIAAQRVLAAQAFVTVEKSALYPSVDAVGSAERQQGVHRALSSAFGGGRVFWELDIWGRIRRSTEAARGQYLAQEAVQQRDIGRHDERAHRNVHEPARHRRAQELPRAVVVAHPAVAAGVVVVRGPVGPRARSTSE